MIQLDSSLARFLDTHGGLMLGGGSQRNGFMIQMAIGGALIVVGVGLAIAGTVFHNGAQYGAAGPLIAGLVNFGIGQHYYRRYKAAPIGSAHLTDQGRQLLRQLIMMLQSRRVNPWGWQQYTGPGYQVPQPARNQWSVPGMTGSRQIPNVNPEAIALLEETARHYNRLASLGEAHRNSPSELAKLAPRLMMAAEEGMAEALHHAAMLFLFPEGGVASKQRIKTINRMLGETADRAEAMSVREPSISERLGYRSAMDDVLEDLRLTQSAHDELQMEREKSQEELNS
jgi:hypothetical protein